MRVVVGLGNPGRKYVNTRHNAGFMVIDAMASARGLVLREKAGLYETVETVVAAQVVILVKPLTYMNLSGHAADDVLRRRGLCGSDVIVVQDDVDIECGRLKIKRGGSSGGHRGVQSIIEAVGYDFTRVKLGIGRDPDVPVERYVLGRFSASEADAIREAIERACGAVECIIAEGVEAAMNRFNAA